MVLSIASSDSRPVVWIGPDSDELNLTRDLVALDLERLGIPFKTFDCLEDAFKEATHTPQTPQLGVLATNSTAQWSIECIAQLTRAWPLMPVVLVTSTLVEGRRRSGPALPGIEDVPWCDLPGRLHTWLSTWQMGRTGTLAAPMASRRDERLLGITANTNDTQKTVSVVASTPMDAEGIASLIPLAGGVLTTTSYHRPSLEESSSVLIWDVGTPTSDDMSWLAMLSANRPHLKIIMIESFPRADTVRAALDAGATAVITKPLSHEALMGIFSQIDVDTDGIGPTTEHC